jgi:hypothetical protein
MNFFKSFTKPLMLLSAALLLVGLATGCNGGQGPILGSGLPNLVSLTVAPTTASVAVTGTQPFTATATFSDGSARDVTTTSSWSSGTPSIATVGAATGVATGLAGGTALITATYGSKSGSATLTVNTVTSVSFVVTPATASTPVSGTQQFAAIQTFSDGTTQDRTTTSVWSTSGASAARASVGAATGRALGITVTPAGVPVVINATFGALVATPANLTVNAATPVVFMVTPATASIPVSGAQQFAAIQVFSDGTTQDRTATSVWSTSGASAANASVGAATGRALGITVTPAGVPVVINATFGALVATPAALTVNAATSVSFVVTPALASIPVSGNQQFAAIQTFSDGTTQDRTATSAWSTSGASSANASVGAATGRALGITLTPAGVPVVINATFGTLIATPANLTVNAATSVSFVVTPATASIPVSGAQQFAAIQTFSDGTTQDRTLTSVWSTSGVSTANASVGLATGRALGITVTPAGVPVVINATFGTLIATPAALTVNAATPVSFVVTPATASVPVSGAQQFAAIQTFSDGTTQDRTITSAWSTSGVSAANASVGLATGRALGITVTPVGVPVVIQATFGTLIATPANLTVSAATVVSISVTPATASIQVNGTQQYTATAIFSDGSSINVTTNSGTVWLSATLGVATFAAPPTVTGIATGVAIGTSDITARYSVGIDTVTSPPAAAILTVTAPNFGPAGGVDLKSTAPFGIIAYDAITISGGHIYGDVALTQPTSAGGTIASVTGAGTNDSGSAPLLASSNVTTSNGVHPGMITAANNGDNIAALPVLLADLGDVYADLLGRAAGPSVLTDPASAAGVAGGSFAAATDLSGYVLSPGIYTSPLTYGLSNISGPLVLDAKGNPDAVFIIRSTGVGISGLTSTTGSVLLQGGAQAKNVYWVVDNLTVGGGTFFQGTVVAGHAITLNAFANVEGRMMAGALHLVSGAITLSGTNVVTVPK